MRLLASIRPPWQAVAHLEAIVRPEWAHAQANRMRWTYPAHWRIHLASFGDVLKADVPELCDVFVKHVAQLEPPKLRMAHFNVDDDVPGTIGVSLDGDLSTVGYLAESIPRWMKALGFVLDRRAYRPLVVIGRRVSDAPEVHLAELAARLGDYEGRPWIADAVTLGYDTPATSRYNAGFTVVREAHFAGRGPGGTA